MTMAPNDSHDAGSRARSVVCALCWAKQILLLASSVFLFFPTPSQTPRVIAGPITVG
jgi:hypothetical protein